MGNMICEAPMGVGPKLGQSSLGSLNGAGLAVEECVEGSVAQLSTLCSARALCLPLAATRQGCLSLALP